MSRADEARKKAAKEIERAELEDRIAAALPPGYPFKITGRGLYGAVADVSLEPADKYGGPRYGQPRGYAPSPDEVAELAAFLPPVPLVLRKGGCTSFVPASFADPREREDGPREGVAPFVWHAETLNNKGTFVAVEWYAELAGVGLIRVSVEMDAEADVNRRLGRIEIRWAQDGGYGGERGRNDNIKDCRYARPAALDSLGGGLREIRWASGGPQYANKFSVYWLDQGMTIKGVIDRVCETPAERAARAARRKGGVTMARTTVHKFAKTSGLERFTHALCGAVVASEDKASRERHTFSADDAAVTCGKCKDKLKKKAEREAAKLAAAAEPADAVKHADRCGAEAWGGIRHDERYVCTLPQGHAGTFHRDSTRGGEKWPAGSSP